MRRVDIREIGVERNEEQKRAYYKAWLLRGSWFFFLFAAYKIYSCFGGAFGALLCLSVVVFYAYYFLDFVG